MTLDLSYALVGDGLAQAVAGGRTVRYAHMDHAASAPPLARVLAAVTDAAAWYANVHRGAGAKSRLSTAAYEDARASVAAAIGADPSSQVLIFTRNTTEALNHLAQAWPMPAGFVVLVTGMEHHSNDLPWRRTGTVVRVRVDADGCVDQAHLRALLHAHRGRIAVLAVTAASNVTGIVNPVHRWAEWVHAAGGRIVVDAAQLAPHRPLDCRPAADPSHLDAVAFSGHKCYAPFGAGALVAPRDVLGAAEPAEVGGGTVALVDDTDVAWNALPDRAEAGTPCVLGAIALAEALRALAAIGWDEVRAHELAIATRLEAGLHAVPGLTVYGRADDRVGVFAFNLVDRPHGLVAAVLDREWGVGTRHGCFCAQPYVRTLLRLDDHDVREAGRRAAAGDHAGQPGMVRASVGLASRPDDADRLLAGLRAVADGAHGSYVESHHGDWVPA